MIETGRLSRLCWFGLVQRMEENRIPKRVLQGGSNMTGTVTGLFTHKQSRSYLNHLVYMNLGTTRLRGRPRNRCQDEVREDGQRVGGEGWQEKVHSREEWKKLLRTARNCRILHVPKEWMNIFFISIIERSECCFIVLWTSCVIMDHSHTDKTQHRSNYLYFLPFSKSPISLYVFPCHVMALYSRNWK